MKKILPLFLLLLAVHARGKEIELKTTITDVTVFQSGAQVKRTGTVTLPAGEYEVVIRDATSLLKKESIQVKGDGSFTIISVNHQVDLGDQEQDKAKWAELESKEKELRRKMEDVSVKIEVLRTEEAVVNNLQSVSTTTEGVTVEQIAKAQELLKTKLALIKNEKLVASRQMKELYDEHQTVTQQLSVLKTPKQHVTYEIIVKVLAKAETKAEFTLSYIVPNARWFPTYDLRVKTVAEPMVIDYKANVTQQTGEDWNNVKLKLSTGDPSLSSQKPKIETWWLSLNRPYVQPRQQSNYYRYTDARFTKVKGTVMDRTTGEALPFCSVMVEGTNIGTSTDLNGNFSLVLPENGNNLKVSYVGYEAQVLAVTSEDMKIYLESGVQLEEVQIVSNTAGVYDGISDQISKVPGVRGGRSDKNKYIANAVTATPTLNIVSTEFTIDEKYTIISDPKNITVAIQSIQSNVKYQYYCAPRLDKDVFLTAQMVDWEQYNLLEGQANVFFEGTFIGSTLLDTRYLTDTLEISLGRDKSVKVERKKSKDFNKHAVFGSDNIANRQWDITVRNGKQQSIDIILEDQFPVSADSKIDVKQEEKSGGKLDEKTGIVTWQYQLEPGGTKTMQLKYTARYPKGTFIGLD
ncbi:MAG: hypothetical protein JWO44_997 [Bacteroidetes bacterium]|nr:hypothetical protein [Bacteroidota bacterium]